MKIETILKIPVSCEKKGDTAHLILSWLNNFSKKRVFVCANPHSLIQGQKDLLFKEALLNADMVTPDGFGIVLASRILGGNINERVTGADVFFGVSELLNSYGGFSYFFLGSDNDTLKRIEERMKVDYPNIRLSGSYSPPYKTEFNSVDNKAMVDAINNANPDVLWVGMTAPKQEKWIYKNIEFLNIKFAGAIGAVFDFYSGKIKRSPPFFQKLGLEWLHRLIQEPRRLWKRNFISSPKFLFRLFLERLERF